MRTPSPLVSALMPAYNAEKHLAKAIESIQAQTLTDWELVIVDDGSTDLTRKIAMKHASSDSRIRVVRLPANLGRPAACNTSIEHSRGRFLAITDADDISLPCRFELQVDAMGRDPALGIVSGQLATIDESGASIGANHRYPLDGPAIREKFRNGKMALANPAAMMRRELFERFGFYAEECLRGQDLEFFLRIFETVEAANLDETLVEYRRSRDSYRFAAIHQSGRYGRYASYRASTIRGDRVPLPFSRYHPTPFQKAWWFAQDIAVFARDRSRRFTNTPKN